MITVMTYEMPKLPYTNNALEPVISQQTIDYHYGKHLQTYVNNLNNLVPGTEFEGKDLVTIVATAPDGAIFNNAGQVLNHTLYFLQFAPKPAHSEPTGKLAEAIKRDFGSFENFKKEILLLLIVIEMMYTVSIIPVDTEIRCSRLQTGKTFNCFL